MVGGVQDKKKVALITGITGQDGFYLSKILLSNGYIVYGSTRKKNLKLSIKKNLNIKLFLTDYSVQSIIKILKNIKPGYIFNLTGQSYVSKSWELLSETINSQGLIVSNLIDAIIKVDPKIKLLNMTSAEMFDVNQNKPLSELSPIKPYNPYGCAQALGHNLIRIYREKKNIWASNSILFPHESERRPKKFLFSKIIDQVKKIADGRQKILKIGNLNVERDWGYAPIFMEGVFRQSQLKKPTDICFCTNKSYSVKDILTRAFLHYRMNYKNYIKVDKDLVRHYEPKKIIGSFNKAKTLLNWHPKYDALDIIDMLTEKKFSD